MAQPAKAAPAPAAEAPAPAKSNKLLIIIIALLLVIIAGGAGWFFTKGHDAPADTHAEAPKPEPVAEPKFIPMPEKFTVNLQREDGDQYLQAGITLKIQNPELEPKIKAALPEIHSKLLLLLSSKKASELLSVEGKQLLVKQIIAEVNGILGIAAGAQAQGEAAAHGEGHGDAQAATTAEHQPPAKSEGVVDVLFSDFIIQ